VLCLVASPLLADAQTDRLVGSDTLPCPPFYALQSDACRGLQLRCHTAKEGHLFRKFGCGAAGSLAGGAGSLAGRAAPLAGAGSGASICPCSGKPAACPCHEQIEQAAGALLGHAHLGCCVGCRRWGNRKSLVEDPAAAGLDVRAELLQYYKSVGGTNDLGGREGGGNQMGDIR